MLMEARSMKQLGLVAEPLIERDAAKKEGVRTNGLEFFNIHFPYAERICRHGQAKIWRWFDCKWKFIEVDGNVLVVGTELVCNVLVGGADAGQCDAAGALDR